MKNIFKCKQGAALATVMIVFAVVAIVGTTMLSTSLGQVNSSVSVQRMTADNTLAESYVDVTTRQIIEAYKALDKAKANLDTLHNNPPSEPDEVDAYNINLSDAYDEYIKAEDFLNNNIIPAGEPRYADVDVEGVGTQRVKIETQGSNQLKVSCTINTSTARARVSSLSAESTVSIPQYELNSTWFTDYSMYAWGDMTIKKLTNDNFDNFGNIAATGTINAPPVPEKKKSSNSAVMDMPILRPEDISFYNTSEYSPYKLGSLTGTQGIEHKNSGYYGAVGSTGTDITWNVNTSNGDVILVLDSLAAKKFKVNVSGDGYFYLYVKENYNGSNFKKTELMTFNNTMQINSSGTDVQTFIIVYNDRLQAYKPAENPKYIPALEIKDIVPSNDPLMDTITFKSGSNVTAHAIFYAPGCNLLIENNIDYIASFYVSNLEIEQGSNLEFTWASVAKTPLASLLKPDGVTGDSTINASTAVDKIYTYNTYSINYDRVWLK